MHTLPICFAAKIADVPFGVRCMCPETEKRLEEYKTEEEPQFIIDLTNKENHKYWDKCVAFLESRMNLGLVSKAELIAIIENGLLQWILCEKLMPYNVFYLHSSAICLDGEAYLFTAPSGTGKSTHTRLWREAFGERAWMINDDRPYLRIFCDYVRVYGTPWMGKHNLGRNDSAPLKAIAWLLRSNKNQIEPLSKADAFPVVLTSSIMLPDRQNLIFLTEEVKTLLDMVPFFKLYCKIDTEAALVAMRGMKTGEFR